MQANPAGNWSELIKYWVILGNSKPVKVIPVLLRWPIKTNDPDFPDSVITFSPGQNLGSLPLEIGILLPTVPGNRVIMEALLQPNTRLEKVAIGIFASDPFLNSDSLLTRLQRANVRWVCNLPALAQYELNFQHYLSEIDMTLEREVKQLAKCRDVGFSTILVISCLLYTSDAADE